METLPLVSVEEYLHNSFRPDSDYVDGVVVERNLGEHDHSRFQMLILAALYLHEREWSIYVLPEQRLRIREGKYRIPDVMVLSQEAPRTPVIETAPLLCIEIVSPDDRLTDLIERAQDYLSLGVPETWILDRSMEAAYIYSAAGLNQTRPSISVLRSVQVELEIVALFGQL